MNGRIGVGGGVHNTGDWLVGIIVVGSLAGTWCDRYWWVSLGVTRKGSREGHGKSLRGGIDNDTEVGHPKK